MVEEGGRGERGEGAAVVTNQRPVRRKNRRRESYVLTSGQ